MNTGEKIAPRGYIFLCSGTKLLGRLWVALASLRDNTDLPITVLLAHVPDEVPVLLSMHGFKVKLIDIERGGKIALLTKTRLHEYTPYEESCFLDADVVVLGKMDEMFNNLTDINFTQFACWSASHRAIERRIRTAMKLGIISKDDYLKSIHTGGMLNIGVFAFRKDASIWKDWYNLSSQLNDRVYIADEVGAQILIGKHPHKILDNKFNISANRPGYLKGWKDKKNDFRCIHMAGRKSFSMEKTDGLAEYSITALKKMIKKDRYSIRTILEKYPYGAERKLLENCRVST